MDYFEYLRLIRESSLSTKARIVALIIASYNPSFPTNKLIAQGTGLSERSVRNAKAELITAGYLRQKRTYNAANHYQPTAPNNQLNTNINIKENTNKGDKSPLDLDININQEIWRIFENEERYSRPPAAGRGN